MTVPPGLLGRMYETAHLADPPILLELTDPDGDPVTIRADAVIAVTVGRLEGRSRVTGQSDPWLTVCLTAGGAVVVAEAPARVVTMWRSAIRAATLALRASDPMRETPS